MEVFRMKITTANLLVMIISLLLVIGLLGCKPQRAKKEAENQNQAESIQKDESITESADLADEPPIDIAASVLEKNNENIQETIESADQTADTMLSKITESESPLSEFAETQSPASELGYESQIKKREDLNEVVKPTTELIRKIQQALANAGFNPGAIDGINGPKTMSALKNFQKQNNLAMGQLTKETLQKLEVPY